MRAKAGRAVTQLTMRHLLFLGFIFAGLGCGKAVGDLSGCVTYNKKPLSHGWIGVLDSDGLVHNARIEPGGSYRFVDMPVGDVKLTASCIDPKINEFARSLLSRNGAPDEEQGRTALDPDPFARFYLIPRKYEDVTKSALTFCVQPGPNVFDIDLQ